MCRVSISMNLACVLKFHFNSYHLPNLSKHSLLHSFDRVNAALLVVLCYLQIACVFKEVRHFAFKCMFRAPMAK